MKYFFTSIYLHFSVAVFSQAPVQGDPLPDRAVYLEAGGPALIYSLNVELARKFASANVQPFARLGVSLIPSIIMVPLEFGALLCRREHLELSGGLTAWFEEPLHPEDIPRIFFLRTGYRITNDNDWIFRFGIQWNMLPNDDFPNFPWPALAVGKTF